MTWSTFDEFFTTASGGNPPRFYQRRLAEMGELPSLVDLPTGVGKTLAIFTAWLWQRRYHSDQAVRQNTPRRLVYCLPVRTLVEQTAEVIRAAACRLEVDLHVHILMGGEVDDEWLLHPEQDAVLVGTQDMLLSRALNRGYAMRRFRWPMAFGLLNNDALWVMDEVQLSGVGLETSAQMQAFRNKLGAFGPTRTVWMSATLRPEWLETVDHLLPADLFRLIPDEAAELAPILKAEKHLALLEICSVTEQGYAAQLARAAADRHEAGTLTLVICNTVDRAVSVYKALKKLTSADPLLIHSRFRPLERQSQMARLRSDVGVSGRIVVSTQVVEAGVDLDAQLLITELAPWPSLVQRLGRCNRKGSGPGSVLWVDVTERPAPYTADELADSRRNFSRLEGKSVCPSNLPPVGVERPVVDALRRRDLLDLFDTTPDLMGNDVDVSRFVRDGDERDLYLFWREWRDSDERDNQLAPQRRELCPAPISKSLKDWVETREVRYFDRLEDRWRQVRPRELRPGMLLMIRASAGGYSTELGWDPAEDKRIQPDPPEQEERPEGMGSDPLSESGQPKTISEHSAEVAAELQTMLRTLSVTEHFVADMKTAAWYHDLGKAHPVFQESMRRGLPEDLQASLSLWAKTGKLRLRHSIPGFRHELASALGFLAHFPEEFLAAYLIASHHGRIRLSIRTLPVHRLEQLGQATAGERRAMGVTQGDPLPAVTLGEGNHFPGVDGLDLALIQLGGERPGWTEQAVQLRDRSDIGPFRLAFMEAALRAADQRASAHAQKEVGV